jgi:adenylate cyclase
MASAKFMRPMLIGLALAALVFLSYHRGLLDIPELKTYDLRFQMRGSIARHVPMVIVSIDQDSFDELDLPWPWPRTLHGELIRKLAASQAKLIGLDILFAEPKPDPEEDRILAQAIKAAGNVVLAAEYTEVDGDFGPRMSIKLPIPEIREHALAYGPVNLRRNRDGIVRNADRAVLFQDRLYPTFAYQIYRGLAGQENLAGEEITPIPYLINFRAPPRSYPIVPYYRVLRDEIDPSFFKDKLVLIGAFAVSLHDLYPTPFSASVLMAGVEVQANFVETLMAHNAITPLPSREHAAIFALLSLLTIWGAFRFKPWRAFTVVLVLAGMYAFATLYLFVQYQLWAPVVPSLLGIVLTYGGITLDNYMREQKDRIRLRTIFGKYVSPDIVDEILENREGLALGGKRRHITVLFSDIRGFTSISEHMEPEQVVSFLSAYLAQATQIVFKHGGTVDKFIGDAIMAIFGAPTSHGDDAVRAVKCGLDLIELVKSLGPKWGTILGRPFQVGVGINSGEAVVGSIGSEIRADFTAIGDTVNLAARLEALTKELQVPMLISEYTAAELGHSISLKALRRVQVTGRAASLLVYTPESCLNAAGEAVGSPLDSYVQQHK